METPRGCQARPRQLEAKRSQIVQSPVVGGRCPCGIATRWVFWARLPGVSYERMTWSRYRFELLAHVLSLSNGQQTC